MILTVAHSKGGVGKSTLAWSLAFALLKKSSTKRVRIIDLDFQQTIFFLNILAEDRLEVLRPQTASEFLEKLEEPWIKSEGSYLIVDTGGFDIDINRLAIEKADKVLVPISESPMDIIGFETFRAALKGTSNVSVVLNNIHPLQKDFSSIKKALEGINLLETVVRQRKVYKTVLAKGKSVFDSEDKKAKDEIKSLLEELLGAKHAD